MKPSRIFIVAFVFASCAFASNIPHARSGRIEIDGDAKWDYLSIDKSHNRLYVSHGTKVNIVDLATNKLIAEIGDQHGVHGIAFAPEFNRGFISNGGDNTVTVFDLTTMKAMASITIPGKKPDAIVYDPFTQRIFSFNGGSNNATAIDAKTAAVVGNVALDGAPEFAASDEAGRMFVNLEDVGAVNVFDPSTFKVIAKWPLAPCATPTGMAIDLKHQLLFVGGRNTLLAVVNAKTGALVTTLPIGEGVDACAFDPVSQCVFSSCGKDGVVTVIKEESPTSFKVIDNIPTLAKARTLALDETTHKLYLSTMIERPADTTPDVAHTQSPTMFGVLILQ